MDKLSTNEKKAQDSFLTIICQLFWSESSSQWNVGGSDLCHFLDWSIKSSMSVDERRERLGVCLYFPSVPHRISESGGV